MSYREHKKERDSLVDEMVKEIAQLTREHNTIQKSLEPNGGLVIIGKLIEE